MSDAPAAFELRDVSFRYGDRVALDSLGFRIHPGEVFGFLGPNGGGKSTLFRLLSTLVPLQSGTVSVLGLDLSQDVLEVRRRLGVVFQSPSLDRKLSVAENIDCAGALYGLSGRELRSARDHALANAGLTERAGDRVETLSGGLRRRVELAKATLHRPSLLLLDEPSTGLDPGARVDLWDGLRRLRAEAGVTVVFTTHLLEEAERADRLALLHEGRLVALDTPDALRATLGGDAVELKCSDAAAMSQKLLDAFQLSVRIVEGGVRFEAATGGVWVSRILERFGKEVRSITVGKPTLEDVFLARTGHRLAREGVAQ